MPDPSPRIHRSSPAAISALALAAAAGAAAAQPLQWQGQFALASELTDRGLSVFERRPTVQGDVTVFAGRWALAAALSASATNGRDSRALLRLSHYRALSDDWQVDAGLGYYGYPGAEYARAFDRTEAALGFAFRDLLSFGVTAIDYRAWPGHRAGLQWAHDVGVRWPLAGGWSLTASLGQADLPPRPDRRYRYGGAGLAWQDAGWRVELNRLGTDATGRQLMGSAAQSRWSFVAVKIF